MVNGVMSADEVQPGEVRVPVTGDELAPAWPGQYDSDVAQPDFVLIGLTQPASAPGRVPVPVTPPYAGDPFCRPLGELEVLAPDHPANADVAALDARL